MQKTILFILIFLNIDLFIGIDSAAAVSNVKTPSIDASEVISEINNYRQQNGIKAFTVNSTLLSLAQEQSDYQAATKSITHTGPGGTTPTDRAYAAGYGGGKKIFISELVFAGTEATTNDALSFWKSSPLHNRIMLDSQYQEIGVGVSTDGDWNFFTAEIAWVTIYSAPANAGTVNSPGDIEEPQDIPAPVPVAIVKAAPKEDGSIVHTVQEGQTLWAIAAVYDIDLDLLAKQNNLTRTSLIFPGDEIIIQQATSLTQTTGTRPQTIGEAVSLSLKPSPTTNPTKTPTPAIQLSSNESPQNPAVWWVTILAFVVIFMVVVGSLFIQKQP